MLEKFLNAQPDVSATNIIPEETRVVFKMTKEKNPECIAFLLDLEANPGFVMSYMHIGQHGEAIYEFAEKDCRLATEEEYADLYKELESIGYKLYIRKRITKNLSDKQIFHRSP